MHLQNAARLWPLFSVLRLVLAQSQAQWDVLNATVGGRLHVNTPFELPCFSVYNGKQVVINEAECTTVRENYDVAGFRANFPSGYYYSQGEMCLSDPADACVLNSSVTPAAMPAAGASCSQGDLPSYYIDVRESTDVTAAMAFSNITGVPLVIKNSGHDYATRSSQKGALMLWVHNLKDMVQHDNFVPSGCTSGTSAGRAITVATGVSSDEAVIFASDHNSTILVGASTEIAISGGWVLGGGHGILSPVYGLGADRAVEFNIVTPDGVLRIVNECQNQDLYWALKGGGGGTFGVVMSVVHRVEPKLPIAVAHITLPSNITADTSLEWIELVARESLTWGKSGWGGHVQGTGMTYVNPLPGMANLKDNGTAAQESVRNATEFALSLGGTSVVEVLPDFLSVWNTYIKATTGGASPGLPTSRLIPRSLFSTDEGIEKLMGYFTAVQELGFDPRTTYVPADTPFVATDSKPGKGTNATTNYGTSVHPAWYSVLWSITGGTVFPFNSSYATRLQDLTVVTEVTILSEQLTGSAGASYPNEANPFAWNWQQNGWGANYERLLDIKKKYDPHGLLKCWKCVGFEDADITTERYRCEGNLQQDIIAALS
ncbi:hypothetical protein F5Y16DRAFT_394190 [Xylariaceae sp. FL0255]|nr:hypothetical protein F5Y16DRAFT_394190 [Xylariaceae sp. FL0255]